MLGFEPSAGSGFSKQQRRNSDEVDPFPPNNGGSGGHPISRELFCFPLGYPGYFRIAGGQHGDTEKLKLR